MPRRGIRPSALFRSSRLPLLTLLQVLPSRSTGDFSTVYRKLADELNACGMYAEQSGGLALNYGFEERGINRTMLDIFRSRNAAIRFASDAHRPEDVGANIAKMQSALLV